MALTDFQRSVCRLIAQSRIESGESDVAGAAALNEILAAPRESHDIDLFHDTEDALQVSWESDRKLLEGHGLTVRTVRERPAFVEAVVSHGSERLLLQWVRDSAYRFFPLVAHSDFGLTMHPFDLATNKVLALVGRLEVRDWIDTIECNAKVQPLGYLAWAACGKDPGLSPALILERAARSHYSAEEVRALAFSGLPPDAGELSRLWRGLLTRATETIQELPEEDLGKCVLSSTGNLFTGDAEALRVALFAGSVRFHAGSIRGALPSLVQSGDAVPPDPRGTGHAG
jgi:hypothetical protein